MNADGGQTNKMEPRRADKHKIAKTAKTAEITRGSSVTRTS